MKSAQWVFTRATKQAIVQLIPIMDEHHLLVGLKDDKVTSPKKTPEKRAMKKAVEEVSEGEKIDSSSESIMYLLWTC